MVDHTAACPQLIGHYTRPADLTDGGVTGRFNPSAGDKSVELGQIRNLSGQYGVPSFLGSYRSRQG